jgi:hypothetical protein
MTKNRQILLRTISIVAGILALVGAVIFLLPGLLEQEGFKDRQEGLQDKQNGFNDTYEEYIHLLNNTYPSDIIVYGEDVGFRPDLNHRVITGITRENLISDPKYQYSFFVINDRNGTLIITDEEFGLCKIIAEENRQSFYYIGQHYIPKLREQGFFTEYLFNDDYHGIAYVISPNETGHADIHGVWTSEEEEMYLTHKDVLGQALVRSFVRHVIKEFS